MYIAMKRDKPIIFRSLVLTLKANGTVELSSEGVRDLMLNLSRIVDTKDAVSSNPADTFEALIGAGMEDELNRAARSALSAAAVAAGEDVSVLDAFVLGEPELLDGSPRARSTRCSQRRRLRVHGCGGRAAEARALRSSARQGRLHRSRYRAQRSAMLVEYGADLHAKDKVEFLQIRNCLP
jgi:hypothetical protein